MSITIQPELESILRRRAEAEGLTVEAYIERLARDDQAAEQEMEALVLDGLNSGQSIEGSEEYWDGKRRRLVERCAKNIAR
jgi:antitoxin ParD1/3/4